MPARPATSAELDLAGEPALGHRDRVIAAMAASIEEKGYRDTTVADVVRLARTSRRNFYEHFEDRDSCFLALFDATNQAMLERIAAAAHPEDALEEQVDRAVDVYISHVVGRPALYASFTREMPALGEAGKDRARATLERFAATLVILIDAGRRAQPGFTARALDMDTAIIIVGGLRELLVISLADGRDMNELRASIGRAIKAILTGTLM